jgi:hypothetical protein
VETAVMVALVETAVMVALVETAAMVALVETAVMVEMSDKLYHNATIYSLYKNIQSLNFE